MIFKECFFFIYLLTESSSMDSIVNSGNKSNRSEYLSVSIVRECCDGSNHQPSS